MTLTVDDIARLTSTPPRTVRYRLARDPDARREPRPGGVGGVRHTIDLDAYCASRCLDRAEVLSMLVRGHA